MSPKAVFKMTFKGYFMRKFCQRRRFFSHSGGAGIFHGYIIRVLLAAFLCIACSESLMAQYVVDTWTSRNGLPSNGVNSIIQTEDGYLWLSTFNGLVRFDGVKFASFQSSNTPGLLTNRTSHIYEDSKERLWIGTSTDQLTVIEKDSSYHVGLKQGFDGGQINDIIEDADGRIWIGASGGLYWWDEVRHRMQRFVDFGRESDYVELQISSEPQIFRRFSTQSVSRFYKDKEGILWVVSQTRIWPLTATCIEYLSKAGAGGCRDFVRITPDRLIHIDPSLADSYSEIHNGEKTFAEIAQTDSVHVVDIKNESEYIPYFLALARSADGTWWVGTANGLIRYTGEETTITSEEELSQGSIRNLYVDSNQRLWIGMQSGLQMIEPGGRGPGNPVPEFSGNMINYIEEDHEQSIWIGTNASGLKRIKSTPILVIGEPEGLTSNMILSVHEDARGNLWVGTNCFGFNQISPLSGRNLQTMGSVSAGGLVQKSFQTSVTRYWNNTGWRNGCVWSMRTTRDGTLWIGEWGSGLSIMKPGEEIRYAPFNDQFVRKTIHALFEDRQGGLWIGTRGSGAYRWYQNELVSIGASDDNDFNKSVITHIFQSQDGAIWLSTYDGIMHYQNGEITRIGTEDGLSHQHVRMLMEPSPGKIWAGTYGGGMNQIELVNGDSMRIQTIDTRQGLFDEVVSQFFEDDYGRIWLGGNKGISHLPKQMLADYFQGDRKSVEVTSYGFEEGMRSNETNGGFQPSGGKTRNGNLLFPTVNGLVIADPSGIKENNSPPRVVVEQLQAGETVLQADSSIYLAAGSNDFEITYTALSFLNPDKMEFEYRLEGFDSAWRPAGNRRTAFFTNIPPGEYSFQVRASNNDGVWNQEGASIDVIVAPFFFQTSWFYGLCLLGFAGLIIWGYNWRVSHLKQRERVLENTVKQQTAALETQNKKLKEMDQVKSRFFANLSHEFRTPLTLIVGPINKLLSEKNYQNIEYDLSLMQRNGIRLQRLIDQILDLVKLESKSLKLDLQEFNLKEFVFKVVDLFRPLASQQALTLVIKECTDSQEDRENDDFITVADKDKVEHILANLLSNAIKFTDEGGQITVDLRSTPNRVLVSVTDTGKGISEENQKYIFDRFYQVEEGERRPAEGMGIGLALCKELMLLHHGNITVKSEQGKGSTFTLDFLKGTDHFGESTKNLRPVTGNKAVTDMNLNLIPEKNGTSENKSIEEDSVVSNHDQTTLLIVEDHLDMREYLKSILAEDYKILESTNGEEALEVIEKNPPDLIIADVMMPVMDGFTFSRHLRKNPLHKNIPILFLTAQAGDENEIKALQEGGDSYLQKPFNSDLLKTRIISLLSLQQRLREQLLSDALVNKDTGNSSSKENDGESQKEREHFQHGNWTSELLHHMQSKLSDPNFGVDQLAELMNVSRSQLHRKTKKATGRSPVQLLRETRLKKSRQLIEEGETNYSEIAYACGFNSLSYFSRSYKKQFGYAPSDTSSVQNKSET